MTDLTDHKYNCSSLEHAPGDLPANHGEVFTYQYDERHRNGAADGDHVHTHQEPWASHHPPRPPYQRHMSQESIPVSHHGSYHVRSNSYSQIHERRPKLRPNAIRTQTHHQSRCVPNVNGCGLPTDVQVKTGYLSNDSPSPHGSTSDSGVSSQRSSISRQADSWKDHGNMVNSASFDHSSHMRYYPQMSRSVTPDTLTMTESRYDYDTASLPRTPHSSNRAVRKLPFSSTQRPLRSCSQMDVTHSASRSRYHGLPNIEALPNRFSPHQFHQGGSVSNIGSLPRTRESISSQESILTYVEGYGYGHTNLQGRAPALNRTTSFNSEIDIRQSPSIPNLPRHPSPRSGHSLHRRGLPVAPHYASSPVVNMGQSPQSPTAHGPGPPHSPKYSPVAAIAEEEESEEPAVATVKKLKRKPSRKVLDTIVQKLSGHSKVTNEPDGGCPQHLEERSSESIPKPNSPESHDEFPASTPGRNVVPALVGLRNHGNTCYLNSVIQCLSNTDRLAEYFVLGNHQEDLLKVKKNRSRKFGTKGEVTDGFAKLLQSIWFLKYSPSCTEDFQRVVGKYASQYKGDEQHDAQEFLIWLLDIVHEDLNSGSSKKKFKPIKNSHNKPDQLLAAESQANYLRHNSSFIHDIFHAQFRSSLKCSNCGQQSCTFEPFLCLSLPIPQRTTRILSVVVVFITGEPRVIKIAVAVEASGSITELRGEVAKQCQIAVTRLVLCEVYRSGFYRCFSDHQPLSDISDQDSVYGIEIPNNSHSALTTSQVRPYIHGVYHGQPIKEPVTLVVINQVGYGRVGKRFGQPMAIEVDRNVNFNQLKVVLLKAMGCTSIEDVMTRNCSIRIGVFSDQNGSRSNITSQSSRPLYHHIVSSMLHFTASKGEPPHVKAIVEWKEDLTHLEFLVELGGCVPQHGARFRTNIQPHTFQQLYIGAVDMTISETEDYERLMSSHTQPVLATLHDCLDLFTQEEKLAADNAWQCMNCHKLQQCTKRLSLWSLPEILVMHLKRFKQTSSSRHKLSTMVQFPVNGLDLSSYVEQNQNQNNQSGSMTKINLINNLTKWSQWRSLPRRSSSVSQGSQCIYDLHAVCNHVGSLSGGHYTAYCKNSTNNQWYHFDDTKITSVSEDSVVSKGAYMLFYHRRPPVKSAMSGSFSHWWLLQDSDNPPSTDPLMSSLPRKGKAEPPPQQGYINGFGSLRLREIRKSKRKEPGKKTWNLRALHSQESLDSGIVISNGQADLDGEWSNGYTEERKDEDGGFSARPVVRGVSDHSPTVVEAEVYRTAPESRI